MKRLLLTAALFVSLCAAQTKFEVTSVKKGPCQLDNSRDLSAITYKGYYLHLILMEAYGVKKDQIAGPSWLMEDCFDIAGKLPEGATKEQVPEMLQALLAERFGLVAHTEERPQQVYALVVDKGGSKMQVAGPNAAGGRAGQVMFGSGGGKIRGAVTMATLANHISGSVDHPVQDFTGLAGKYYVDLEWTPDPAFHKPGMFEMASGPDAPAKAPYDPSTDVYTVIREKLGLRLEPRKLPVKTLVIDKIERTPTGN